MIKTVYFIIVFTFATSVGKAQKIETYTYATYRYANSTSSPADTKEVRRQKLQKIRFTHSLLKGGIWDDIYENMVYVPQATYCVDYSGSDINNPPINLGDKHKMATVVGHYLLNTEVTNKMYRYFLVESNNSAYRSQFGADTSIAVDTLNARFHVNVKGKQFSLKDYEALDDYPVVGITHEAASAFCRWLTQKAMNELASMGIEVRKDRRIAISFHLPTEGEYEAASIMNLVDEEAKSEKLFNTLHEKINGRKPEINCGATVKNNITVRTADADGFYFTNPVKQFPAGKIGLYGMQGNAAEWAAEVMRLARGALLETSNDNIVKGGSWYDSDFYMQSCLRQRYSPQKASERVGFRISLFDPE